MELVDGEPLRKRIPASGLPLDRLLDQGRQLADALAAAHDAGVTHRDLKPDNLMVTAKGRIKVLDFGLALPAAAPQQDPSGSGSDAPTEAELTREGRVLGTPAYMSPEQAEGGKVDHRSDIFSLGVILYELATGQRPFQGDSMASILSSILRDDPPSLKELRPDFPNHLARIVRRCLAKPVDQRIAFRSERDGGGLFVMGATGESIRRISDFGYNPSWSPDGGKVVFASEPSNLFLTYPGSSELWVVDIVNGKPSRIEGADGAQPAWSPNGHRIAYTTIRANRYRDVLTIAVEGGAPTSVTDSEDRNLWPSWSPDGRSLFYSGRLGYMRVAIDEATGRVRGEPEPVQATLGTRPAMLSLRSDVGAWSVLSQRASIEAAELDQESRVVVGAHREILRDTTGLTVYDVSPDGTTLLGLVTTGPFSWDLFSVGIDGTGRRELAQGTLAYARWSPDGERIVLAWKRTDNLAICTIRSDGSDLRVLAHDPAGVNLYPVWSVDGLLR